MGSNDQALPQAMENILLSQHDTDVTFLVHGKELHAHKLIICNRSPVLKAMIEGPMAPADQQHEINDPEITVDDFENFLKFLYTDECVIKQSNFKTMLHLANFYDVPRLQEKCADDLYRFSDGIDNVLKYAELGLQYSPRSPLLKRCFDIINAHFDKTRFCYQVDDGSTVWITPELTLEFVKLFIKSYWNEDQLFKKVFEWAKNYCIQQDQESNVENIQAIIAPIMPHFQPQQFSPATLATIIKEYKLIPVEQLLDYLGNHVMKKVDARGNLLSPGDSRSAQQRADIPHRGGNVRPFSIRFRQHGEGPPNRGRGGAAVRGVGGGRGGANGNGYSNQEIYYEMPTFEACGMSAWNEWYLSHQSDME